MTADPSEEPQPEDSTTERALDEFPDLLQQAKPEPRYTSADIALIEEKLTRFNQIVDVAYRSIEELPEPAKVRRLRRRTLLKLREQLCRTIRFNAKCGIPTWAELDRLDFIRF